MFCMNKQCFCRNLFLTDLRHQRLKIKIDLLLFYREHFYGFSENELKVKILTSVVTVFFSLNYRILWKMIYLIAIYCSWKCHALFAIMVVLLLLIIIFVISSDKFLKTIWYRNFWKMWRRSTDDDPQTYIFLPK